MNKCQVYTPDSIAQLMVQLMERNGDTLEPCAGAGVFSNYIENIFQMDISPSNAEVRKMDFFSLVEGEFDTIITNPPYVRGRDIAKSTRELFGPSILNGTANLYLRFMEKSFHHLKDNGEMIFIVPKTVFNSTQAMPLTKMMMEHGTFTHVNDVSPEWDAAVSVVIFRYQKDVFQETAVKNGETVFVYAGPTGKIYFTKERNCVIMDDIATISVGAVPRPKHRGGEISVLTTRGIRAFNDEDGWIRPLKRLDGPLIHFSPITRKTPFHVEDVEYSLLFTIKPKYDINMEDLADDLNSVDWEDLGFTDDKRYLFGQKSLRFAVLPSLFNKYILTNGETQK